MLVLCTKLIKNYNRKLETKAAKETYLNVVSYIQILHFSILHKDDFFFFFCFLLLMIFPLSVPILQGQKEKSIILESSNDLGMEETFKMI